MAKGRDKQKKENKGPKKPKVKKGLRPHEMR
jgi:hypothetical protein